MLITVIQLANNFGIRWQTTDKSAANFTFRVTPADGVSSWKKNNAGSLERVLICFTNICLLSAQKTKPKIGFVWTNAEQYQDTS